MERWSALDIVAGIQLRQVQFYRERDWYTDSDTHTLGCSEVRMSGSRWLSQAMEKSSMKSFWYSKEQDAYNA